VACCLAVLILQFALTARVNSITWDEDDFIYAGYLSWKHADFGVNPEHPPLVKLLAAAPLLSLPLKKPPLQNRNFRLEGFLGGKDILFQNDAETILFRARMAASLLSLLLAVLVFLATQEMFGTGAAFIALGLLIFDPTLLAHGGVVGTDVAGLLNPYEQFKQLRPTAVIDYGVFVFDGHFEIPLAAAISHTQKAGNLLEAKKLPEALAQAQQAVALAPHAVNANAMLGEVLTVMGRPAEARQSYQAALRLARTVEPEFQVGWVERLEKKLAEK
jgi:tetratricopeptide (TPR) repeat protein